LLHLGRVREALLQRINPVGAFALNFDFDEDRERM
jgi:hypothetical protein